MKKILYLIAILLTNNSVINAQKEIVSGVYIEDGGYELHIKDMEVYLILNQGYSLAFESDTLAICTLKNLENGFIELNSLTSEELIQPTMEIRQEYDEFVRKKRVVFKIPCQCDLLIEANTDKNVPYFLDYPNQGSIIELPEQTNNFIYSVELERIQMPHDSGGLFYGIVRYVSDEIEFEEGKNIVIVSLPAMNCSFFERYNLRGDYARIIGDTIIWKGRTFIKDE